MIDSSGKCANFVNYLVWWFERRSNYKNIFILSIATSSDCSWLNDFIRLFSRVMWTLIYTYIHVFCSIQLHVDYSSYERASMALKQYTCTYLICDKYTDLKFILSTVHSNCSCLNYLVFFSPVAYLHLALLATVLNFVIYKYLTCLRL